MPSFSAITINNGDETPVPLSFVPTNRGSDGTAHFAERSSGVPVGYPTVSLNLAQPRPTNDGRTTVYRIKYKVRYPVLATLGTSDAGITPPPTKAYELMSEGTMVIPAACVKADRSNLHAITANLLNSSVVETMITELEAVYS